MQSSWSVAVTTAPRIDCTLLRSLESLVDCGWDSPAVFTEPGSTSTGFLTFTNNSRLGVWHNWLASCRWALDQQSDFVLTVQDDAEFHPQSKELIESINWPSDAGYVSLYTPRHYQFWKDGSPRPNGMYPVKTQSMWGAVALVFKREVLQQLVTHPRALSWLGCRSRTKSKWADIRAKRIANPHMVQNSDTIIGSILTKNLGRKLYYFNPSPVSHFSLHSTCGHGGNGGNRNSFFIADQSIPLNHQIFGDVESGCRSAAQ